MPGRKRDDLRVELAPRQERRQAAARVEVAARGVEALDDAVDQRRRGGRVRDVVPRRGVGLLEDERPARP